MGLLTEGSPLSWEETKELTDHVKNHGVQQFINQYRKMENLTKDEFLWGDEVEYMLVKFNPKKQIAQLSLRGGTVLDQLQEKERVSPDHPALWRPEFGAFHLESSPSRPYGGMLSDMVKVEENMRQRREEIQKMMKEDETPMCLAIFPRLGCPEFTCPVYKPTPQTGYSRSLFFPDEAIFPDHPRFRTVTRNIRLRRGEKVAVNIPVFKDKNTPSPFVENYLPVGDDGSSQRSALPDHIYLDTMSFCACLQATFQGRDVNEARFLYDQLIPLCPIFLSLTAGAPILRGMLVDVDSRWPALKQSMDDRTREERGEEPLRNSSRIINKSRHGSVESYLSRAGEPYNDNDLVYDEVLFEKLRKAGIDRLMSQHIAHLFIRDPILLLKEKIDQDDEEEMDHFENIQSTNWQTMRFKPPPPKSDIGWRVEFRPMDVQLSDFENAAFVVFIALLTRVILQFKLNFLIPIAKVEDNMETAEKRDSVIGSKFYFRKNWFTDSTPFHVPELRLEEKENCPHVVDDYDLLTVNEIINGKVSEMDSDCPGLVPVMRKYIDLLEVDPDVRCTILQYISLISKRASGELMTTARWMRKFVTSHPSYHGDSVVTEGINYDLLEMCRKYSCGEIEIPELCLTPSSRAEMKDTEAKMRVNGMNGEIGNL